LFKLIIRRRTESVGEGDPQGRMQNGGKGKSEDIGNPQKGRGKRGGPIQKHSLMTLFGKT